MLFHKVMGLVGIWTQHQANLAFVARAAAASCDCDCIGGLQAGR